MIITINKKKHNIPEANLLTAGQYIELSNMGKFDIIDYLAYFTGFSKDQLLKSKITVKDLETIAAVLGKLKPIDSFFLIKKLPDELRIGAETFKYKDLNNIVESVGARMILNQKDKSKSLKAFENIIFLLSILISGAKGSLDIEEIERTHESVLKENYIDAFTIACFFFQNFLNSLTKETSFLKRQKLKILTKIQGFGKWPELTV